MYPYKNNRKQTTTHSGQGVDCNNS